MVVGRKRGKIFNGTNLLLEAAPASAPAPDAVVRGKKKRFFTKF